MTHVPHIHDAILPQTQPPLLFKDRQQERRPVLLGLQYNGNHYFPPNVPYMYYISLKKIYGHYIDIRHVEIKGIMNIWAYSKFEKVYLFLYFFNKHISFDNQFKLLKLETQIHEGHLEGSVS